MALAFYPRGGSAQVVRYLARSLANLGHDVKVISGSLKGEDPTRDAAQFFEGLPLLEVDYTEAVRGFAEGVNPMSDRFATPFHPSYEDKPDVPDRLFFRVTEGEMEHLVNSWQHVLYRATAEFHPDVAHLHHLNHIHIAATRSPALAAVAKIAHLHGTELKMLEDAASAPNVPERQRALWSDALRDAAAKMHKHLAISRDNVDRAVSSLGLDKGRIALVPNGVDTTLFQPLTLDPDQKIAELREILVASPRGWQEEGGAGSVRYQETDLRLFRGPSGEMKPLLVFVGRFLAFKRVTLLLEAIARANALLSTEDGDASYNLLILGGVPGEWEGEHPYTTATRLGLGNVFFGGWLSHEELARAINVADVFVAPSYFEPFGQVFLEAMATGLPVIATRSGGPASFVRDDGSAPNGWLCEVDDLDSLTTAIVQAITDNAERSRRGHNALEFVRREYSWNIIAEQVDEIYSKLVALNTDDAMESL